MNGLTTTKKFHKVNTDELAGCPVPGTTNTYEPVPHSKLYSLVREGLARRGYKIADQDLRVTKSGDEFFGILKLQSPCRTNSPWDLSLGLRNTNNKRASAGIFLGTNVWICDNLCYSAEHTFIRKHHAGTIAVLKHGVSEILMNLTSYGERQSVLIQDLQVWTMTPEVRDHMLIDLLRNNAIRAAEVMPILNEFRSPSHENPEAQYNSAWGLFNAVTWIGKQGFDRNPETQATRTIQTTKLFSLGAKKWS